LKPNEPVTRAQFAAIVSKAFSRHPTREAKLTLKMPAAISVYQAIQTASRVGLWLGTQARICSQQKFPSRVQALVSFSHGLVKPDNPSALLQFILDAS